MQCVASPDQYIKLTVDDMSALKIVYVCIFASEFVYKTILEEKKLMEIIKISCPL